MTPNLDTSPSKGIFKGSIGIGMIIPGAKNGREVLSAELQAQAFEVWGVQRLLDTESLQSRRATT